MKQFILFLSIIITVLLVCNPNEPVGGNGSEVSTGTIAGELVSDGQPIDYPVTVFLNYPDDSTPLAKTTASEKAPADSMISTDGTYRFDSLPAGDYHITVFNDVVIVGDTNVVLENDSDSVNVDITITTIIIQYITITNIENNNDYSVNNYYIDNGHIETIDEKLKITTAEFDSLEFELELVHDTDTGMVKVKLINSDSGLIVVLENPDELPVEF